MLQNPPSLTKLIPFNPSRFDGTLSYLFEQVYKRPITLIEAVKHHVMTDVFHVLDTGHQVIGGELQPWPYGPVVEPAYKRLKHLEHCQKEQGDRFRSDDYEVVCSEAASFRPLKPVDLDEVSPSELRAIKKAVDLLRPMSFDDMYHFFHDDSTFMGRAYIRAVNERRGLSWTDIIDNYDEINGTNHDLIRRRLIAY